MRPSGTPPRIDPTVARERETERWRLAGAIDVELRAICRTDVVVRRELGDAARVLLSQRGYRRLGFVRVGDYARERLGIAGRTLECAAWLATRLDALPAVAAALDDGKLTWAQTRAIARAAKHHDQDEWLTRAETCSAEELAEWARASRSATSHPIDPDDDDDDAREIDGEPVVRFRLACPARVRALWRHATELASRVSGEPLSRWRAAEVIAAEAFAGRPAEASFGERAMYTAIRLARRARRLAAGLTAASRTTIASPIAGFDAPAAARPADFLARSTPTPATVPESSAPRAIAPEQRPRHDAFALDARLIHAIAALRRTEPRIGQLLRVLVDHRLYRSLGFPTVDAYVRERLGISSRKAWALLKLERRVRAIPAFAEAYQNGRLSWVRALTLLAVVDRDNARAWLHRATSVTVRRLVDEVNWVLQARDVLGPDAALDPPAQESALAPLIGPLLDGDEHKTAPAHTLQIGTSELPPEASASAAGRCRNTSLGRGLQIAAATAAHAREVCDAEVTLVAPASVVAFVRDTMDAFAEDGEPRWTALERMLHHVVSYWEAAQGHRDPVFARDGWRCTVPACGSRRNLHDHHVQFRSRGGGNDRWNRTAVCVAHHLHGIHDGTVRVWGTAPHALHWELGVRIGAPPLARYFGDAEVSTADTDAAHGLAAF